MNLQISAWSGMFYDKTPEEAVNLFKECGFNTFELSAPTGEKLFKRVLSGSSPEKVGNDFRKYMNDNGFAISQGHLLFNEIDLSDIYNFKSVELLKKWMAIYQASGVKDMVLHIGNKPLQITSKELLDRRVKVIEELTNELKGSDCYLCIENLIYVMNTSEEILALLQAVNSKNVGVCFDTGHLNLSKKLFREYESEEHFFAGVGKYIKAIHINDNDGMVDEHLIPNIATDKMSIELQDEHINLFLITKLLRQYGYEGEYNFECSGEQRAPDKIRMKKLELIKIVGEYYQSLC